jgi:hypothetical protein
MKYSSFACLRIACYPQVSLWIAHRYLVAANDPAAARTPASIALLYSRLATGPLMLLNGHFIAAVVFLFNCVVGTVLIAATAGQTQEPLLLDVLGGVEVWSAPQPAPDDG